MSPIERAARDVMRRELKRYDVPPDTYVTLKEVHDDMLEASANTTELRMSRLTGTGLDATHDHVVFRLRGQFIRSPRAFCDALRVGVEGMCRELFGVHDGEGLP